MTPEHRDWTVFGLVPTQEGHEGSTRVEGAPLGRAPLPRGPPGGPPTPTPTPYIGFRGEKNRREEIIAFYDTEPPPSPNISREGL